MLHWLGKWYSRRLVNVNVNILLANIMAMAFTAVVVHYSRYLGIHDGNKWLIVAFTFAVDLVADVLLYYGLHFVANHWPRRLRGPVSKGTLHILEETPKPSFFKDATIVQAQRLTLAPAFYIVALGGQKWALHEGIDPAWSVFISYGIASLMTRTIHTAWMLTSERSAKARAEKLAESNAQVAGRVASEKPSAAA